jgi:hypothetical protein
MVALRCQNIGEDLIQASVPNRELLGGPPRWLEASLSRSMRADHATLRKILRLKSGKLSVLLR